MLYYAKIERSARATREKDARWDLRNDCLARDSNNSIGLLEEFRQSVIQWLAPYNPTPSYKNALAAHQVGTGQWFLDSPFQKWTTGETPAVLWLQGKRWLTPDLLELG